MSSYNDKKNEPEEKEPHSTRCPAAGCPMMASLFLDGGPWACRYHSKQPVNVWLKITELIKTNDRWFKIIKAAESISGAEYDELLGGGRFQLDELLRPVKGEWHAHWLLRIKDTIYRAMKKQINKIAEQGDLGGTGFKNTLTIHQLTSGVLMKNGKKT